jgi:hypothetical protein
MGLAQCGKGKASQPPIFGVTLCRQLLKCLIGAAGYEQERRFKLSLSRGGRFAQNLEGGRWAIPPKRDQCAKASSALGADELVGIIG